MEKRGLAGYPQSDEWFRGRISLFEQFPLPGMLAQTCKDFRWVLMLGELTPRWVIDVVEGWQRSCANIDILFGDDFVATYRGYIDRHEPQELLLTTRFDSDDSISPFFVSRLQAVAHQVSPGPIGINFMNGLRWVGRWVRSEQEGNPFISVLEPWEPGYKTVFLIKHGHIKLHLPVHQIMGAPAWLQVCHDRNVMNRPTRTDTPRPAENPDWIRAHFPWLNVGLIRSSCRQI